MKICAQLRKFVGDQEVDDLVALKEEYRQLLLKTRSVVRKLMNSSNRQKQNVESLLKLLESFSKNKNEFNKQDKLQYDECINHLSNRIDQDDLVKVIKGWENMIVKLQVAYYNYIVPLLSITRF